MSRDAHRELRIIQTARTARLGRVASPILWACMGLAGIAVLALLAWQFVPPGANDVDPAPARLPAVATDALSNAIRQAIDEARQDVELQPDRGERWGRYGMVLYAHQYNAEAIECLIQAARLDPNNPRWTYLHGMILAETDRAAGLPYLVKALEIAPTNPSIHSRVAEFYLDLGNLKLAQNHFQRAMALDDASARPSVGLARVAMAQGQWDQAQKWATQADQRQPGHREIQLLLARLARQAGDREQAQLLLTKLEANPAAPSGFVDPIIQEAERLRADAEPRTKQADQLFASGQFEQAFQLYRDILRSDPNNVGLYSHAARNAMRIRQYDLAETLVQECLAFKPQDLEARYLKCLLSRTAQESDVAIPILQRLIQEKPDYSEARFLLAACYRDQGQLEEAELQLRELIRLEPVYIEGYVELAAVLEAAGKTEESQAVLDKARRINPDHPKFK